MTAGLSFRAIVSAIVCAANLALPTDCTSNDLAAYRFTRTAVFGDDYRRTPKSYMSKDEERRYLGTGALVCGDELSTVNYLGDKVFAGASHGILSLNARKKIGYALFSIPFDAARIWSDLQYRIQVDDILQRKLDVPANNNIFHNALAAAFAKIAPNCKVYLTDRDGKFVGPPLSLASYKRGSLGTDSYRQNDILKIAVRELDPKLELAAVRLSARNKFEILHEVVSSYAYQSDMNSNRKYKSVGVILPLSPQHVHARLANIVGENVDSMGWSSGAFLYDSNDEAVCMHLGTTRPNPQKLPFDGGDRSNYCRVIDAAFVEFMRTP